MAGDTQQTIWKDGHEWISLRRASFILSRSQIHMKNKYVYAEQANRLDELPELRRDLDTIQTYYVRMDQLEMLNTFTVERGAMAELTRKTYGNRNEYVKQWAKEKRAKAAEVAAAEGRVVKRGRPRKIKEDEKKETANVVETGVSNNGVESESNQSNHLVVILDDHNTPDAEQGLRLEVVQPMDDVITLNRNSLMESLDKAYRLIEEIIYDMNNTSWELEIMSLRGKIEVYSEILGMDMLTDFRFEKIESYVWR